MKTQTVKTKEGRDFPVKIYGDMPASQTIVFLPGAIGLSNLAKPLCDRLSENFNVITFDYPLWCSDVRTLSNAWDDIVKQINTETDTNNEEINKSNKVWLAGQSLGGLLAQSLAADHKDTIKGLILINTGTMERMMSDQAWHDMVKLLSMTKKAEKLVKAMPEKAVNEIIKTVINRITNANTNKDNRQNKNIGKYKQILTNELTKEYGLHMIELLKSTESEAIRLQSDFAPYKDKILLILSPEDKTFSEACRRSLIHLTNQPEVNTNVGFGHMALFEEPDKTARVITEFIEKKENKGTR